MSQDGTFLDGDIAVDEVYLRGKWSSIIVPKKIEFMKRQGLFYPNDPKRTWSRHNIRRAISEYKQPVFGMNDGHNIVLCALPNRFDSLDLASLISQHSKCVKHIISDQSSLYTDIKKQGYDVVQMNHSQHEYTNNGLSSNRIEGTFSHIKRRYRCHYIRPDKKYIQLYLNEFAFRWNNRQEQTLDRLTSVMRLCVSGGRITRKDIDNYTWLDSFHQRRKKKEDTIFDFKDLFDYGVVESIEINGVMYDKEDLAKLGE